MQDNKVLVTQLPLEQGGYLGCLCLNNPEALNAQTLEMTRTLLAQLRLWAADPLCRAVWIEATGSKAFCAGGDIVALYHSIQQSGQGNNPYAEDFFATEYRLDYVIHTYPKPLVVWGQGIIMGGGMGLMMGAAFRIVTQNSRLAMPEVSIGLFPDVGGSWFLNRMPNQTGLFLGLTGIAINAADALWSGLADYFILQEYRDLLLQALQQADWQQPWLCVQQVLSHFAGLGEAALPAAALAPRAARIETLMQVETPVQRVRQLMDLVTEDTWLQQAVSRLHNASPTSLLLVQAQLALLQKATLAEVFQQELVMAINACRLGEFAEGVRALLVDKDRQPRWRYACVEDVPAGWIERYFEAPWPDNPLRDLSDQRQRHDII